jgi:uncharacterized alkaline shock family protein YloU
MAQDFIKLTHPEQLGFTSIKKEVFNSIAFIACQEEKHAVCEKNSSVSSKINDNQLIVKIDVKIQYGQNVSDVSTSIQSKVTQSIEQMTGLLCRNVDVNVIGFVFSAQ